MQTQTTWNTAHFVWAEFVARHPELGYRPGRTHFHNFMRLYREPLVECDAIRLAKRRFWIAEVERFCAAAFDLATGKCPDRVNREPTAVTEASLG